jgi:hypothetical protein
MYLHFRKMLLTVFYAAALMVAMAGFAYAQSADIPKDAMASLESAWTATKDVSSAPRKRLAIKRVLRDAGELVEKNPAAPNRFSALALILSGQQALLGMDDSPALRQEVLETCRKLSEAPDEYAEVRLNADLLLNQTEMARKGADAKERMQALMPLLDRYRDTSAEGKFLQISTLIALELGDAIAIDTLRGEMEQRFAGDLEMIIFLREKLGGQIFGAPISGVFKSSDGRVLRYPMDAMGRTTLVYYWSAQDDGEADLQAVAKAWHTCKEDLANRIEVISINLDELPDAGASILRKHGVDWTALHLPGGVKSQFYQAYGRSYPGFATLSPTGYFALSVAEPVRMRPGDPGLRDYSRLFGSSLAREWTEPEYLAQLCSLLAGEFFVVDPTTPFDPAAPPELRMVHADARIQRDAQCVPDEELKAIQACFIPPALRYETPVAEVRSKFEQAVKQCRATMDAHPQAPDLWIVRNRLIVALLGLAKLDPSATHLSEAAEVAKAAVAAPHPGGADVIARLCLARQSLRDPEVRQKGASERFLTQAGQPTGADLAAAALLAVEVGSPFDYEKHRSAILKDHANNPAMRSFINYLLDREYRYSLFLAPYSGGRVPGYRQNYALTRGAPDEGRRIFHATLPTPDGGTMQIPDTKAGKWTVMVFASPWPVEKGKSGPPNPGQTINPLLAMAEARKLGDVQVILAILDGDAAKTGEMLAAAGKPIQCPVVLVPGGLSHPLAGSLGLCHTKKSVNAVVVAPDGTIIGSSRNKIAEATANLIAWQDEKNVTEAIAKGDLETAKRIAFTLAPTEAPTVTDAKGNVRQLPMPKINVRHRLARAKLYLAMEDMNSALTDADAAVSELIEEAGKISIRIAELDEAEALRDSIRKRLNPDEVK